MKKHIEALSTLTKCFEEMESLMAIIRNRLQSTGVPVKAIFAEYWSFKISNQMMYKLWTGTEHIKPIGEKHAVPYMLASYDILEYIKHKEILYRKF